MNAQTYNFNEVNYTPQQTTFRLAAPTAAREVVVRVYDGDYTTPGKALKTKKMKRAGNDSWELTLKGDLKGKFYTFEVTAQPTVTTPAEALAGKKPNTAVPYGETPGVFAKAVGVNGKRGAIIDLNTTNPSGWQSDVRPNTPLGDLVIYEMHHRDFSIDASSGLEHKGKFLALTEPKAIAYLKDLGITAVHILPSFDYASVDETRLNEPQYNWGYDPLNYNVPEGSYSTDPYNPVVRIREFKQMVQALHQAGIKVFLDVVYNHTFDINGSAFQRTFPDAYYRFKADGKPSDGTACGNETASERPLMRQFMLESMKYWVNEYHIDGFRVDLMGVHDIVTMNELREEMNRIDPSIFIYGEGWSAGACALPTEQLAVKANMPQLPGIAAFSDDMRDALRGPFNDDHKGAFLAGLPGEEESLKYGIVGGIAHPQVDMQRVNYSKKPWTLEPTQQISYVSCHDDMCLTDRLRASIPGISEAELIRLDLLAQTAVFTSQGVPFMMSGEEMLRDKKGVHNSYKSPDEINHLDWDNLKRYPQVYSYYKNLIALHKNHPAFHLGSAEKVRQHLRFLDAQPCVVAFALENLAGIDTWNDIIVVLNGNKEATTLTIPTGTYTVVACDGQINEQGIDTMQGGNITVNAQSALILRR
jgi:pullulanase